MTWGQKSEGCSQKPRSARSPRPGGAGRVSPWSLRRERDPETLRHRYFRLRPSLWGNRGLVFQAPQVCGALLALQGPSPGPGPLGTC